MNQGTPVTGFRHSEDKLSTRMRDIEGEIGQPLGPYICELLNNHGSRASAARLGISPATLGYWLPKLGIRVEKVALRDSQVLRIVEFED